VDQQPDIILSLYNEKEKRVAYLRIPASSPEIDKKQPSWYALKSI
jgi:hypothetical protein